MPRFGKRKTHARASRHDDHGPLGQQEILALLKEQLFLPAQEVDGPLVKECLLALDPDLEEASAKISSRTWARIQDNIAAHNVKTLAPRRLAVIIIAAVLILAMAAIALAVALGALTIQFPSSVRPYETVTEEAETLIQYYLTAAHFEHVDIEVREALYDGEHLRLVYSVRDTRPGAELTEEDILENIIAAARLDNLHGCDWIEVDGQEIYLWDTFQRPGDVPGEMLYYLGINVTEQGISPQGEMTVGLPMLGYIPRQQIPDALRFTVKADLAEGLSYTTEAYVTDIDATTVSVSEGVYSPTGGHIRLTFHREGAREELFQWDLPFQWEFANLYTMEGEELGFVWDAAADYDNEAGVSIEYSIMPPAVWPERMMLAVPDAAGIPKEPWVELCLKR